MSAATYSMYRDITPIKYCFKAYFCATPQSYQSGSLQTGYVYHSLLVMLVIYYFCRGNNVVKIG